MILRPYQEEAINATEKALNHYGNTLVIAPTGAGKTIMMASTIDRLKRKRSGKTVIIQHRLKLVEQNAHKFVQMNGDFYCLNGDVIVSSETLMLLDKKENGMAIVEVDDVSAYGCIEIVNGTVAKIIEKENRPL